MAKRTVRRTGSVEMRNESGTHLGTTVVEAISRATGVPVTEMDTELNDFIDPDALDSLFADRYDGTPRGSGLVIFSMGGCEVRVDGDGHVVVTPE